MGKGRFFDQLMECVQAVICCVCLFFCGGLILICVGAAFYFKTDTRTPKINKFNTAVDLWEASAQADFANSSNFTFVGKNNVLTKLELNVADDKGNSMHDSHTDWHRWSKFAFWRCPSDVSGVGRLCRVGYSTNLNFRDFAFSSANGIQNLLSVQSGFGANVTTINPPGVPMVSRNTLSIPGCSNSSSCPDSIRQSRCVNTLMGVYHAGYCYSTYILERIGFVVAKAGNKYYKSTLYDGVFFTKDSLFGGYNGLTPAALYGAGSDSLYPQNGNNLCSKSTGNSGCDVVLNVALPNVYAEVRSEGDPWVVAVSLTNGAADFGLTKAEEKKIGLVLFVLGILFYVPACLCACVLCKRKEHVADAYNGTYQPQQYNNINNYNPNPYQAPGGAPGYANYGSGNAPAGYGGYGGAPPPQQPSYGNYGAPPPAPAGPSYGNYGAPPPQQQPGYANYGGQPAYGGYGQPSAPYPPPAQNYQGYAPTK